MRVLVLENYDGTELGLVGKALEEARAEIVVVRPFQGDTLPQTTDGFEAMVVLGGAQNALDDANHPWFPAALDLVLAFQHQDKAVLGICLGAQLLARANGASNRIGGHYEFGWHEIGLDQRAADDPVFAALPARFPSFEWHDDHFALPQGAMRLASSPVAENQAFRVGRAAYGMQFHFEVDRPLAARWSKLYAKLLDDREPGWNTGAHEAQAERHGALADDAGLAIARAWVAII